MNEREIIDTISSLVGTTGRDIVVSIGDDCAVIEKDDKTAWLLTMDTLVEAVHFDHAWHAPELLGRKTVSVNVSDVAAMGGEPRFILLSVGLKPQFDPDWFRLFSRGITDACRDYGCLLVGGDTVQSPGGDSFTVTAIGEARKDQVIYRSGARDGDNIWVSGFLGNAAAGLELCKRGRAADTEFTDQINAHVNPEARVTLGKLLGDSGIIRSMMDLSDGLATDLAHLCKRSQVKAHVFASQLPIAKSMVDLATTFEFDAEQLALSGGEDYELLMTVPSQYTSTLLDIGAQCDVNLTQIGTITSCDDEKGGVFLISEDGERKQIDYGGFDHFRAP